MTLMSALHNLSRSFGFALLALSDTHSIVWMFVGGEICLYFLFKIVRRDFYSFLPFTGGVAIIVALLHRLGSKVIVDFCGCIHWRHPKELGGFFFTLSVVWAQLFPFVGLQYFTEENNYRRFTKGAFTVFFVVCLLLWLVLNIIFFCTIDSSYLNTFFGFQTSAQYTCELFTTSSDDYQKFRAVFKNRIDYIDSIHDEVKDWVAGNIDEWKREKPDWFKIEMIPDEYLPEDVFEAEGGDKRRRSSVSLREIVGLREASVGRVHPQADEEMNVEDL